MATTTSAGSGIGRAMRRRISIPDRCRLGEVCTSVELAYNSRAHCRQEHDVIRTQISSRRAVDEEDITSTSEMRYVVEAPIRQLADHGRRPDRADSSSIGDRSARHYSSPSTDCVKHSSTASKRRSLSRISASDALTNRFADDASRACIARITQLIERRSRTSKSPCRRWRCRRRSWRRSRATRRSSTAPAPSSTTTAPTSPSTPTGRWWRLERACRDHGRQDGTPITTAESTVRSGHVR